MQHHVVGQIERRADQAERDGGVDDDEAGADLGGEPVDASGHERVWQQNRFGDSLDPERLLGVELGRAVVRAGQHSELIGRQPAPPLPQQRLDATDLGWEVVRDEEVFHRVRPSRRGEPLGRPFGVFAQHGSTWARYSPSSRCVRASVGVTGVAEHDQRVPAPPDRVAVGEVPATVAIDQRLVIGFEQIEHVDPCLHRIIRRPIAQVDAVTVAEADRRWADLLAVVAAVEAVTERFTELDRERARLLDEPGEASVGIDDAGGDDRPGRAAVEASTARAAAVGDRLLTGYSAVVMIEPSTKKLPAPGSRMLAFLPNHPSPPR